MYKDVPLNGFKRPGLYLVRTYSAISVSGIAFRTSSQHSALMAKSRPYTTHYNTPFFVRKKANLPVWEVRLKAKCELYEHTVCLVDGIYRTR